MLELSVDVTYVCPFSCPFCSSAQTMLPAGLNMELETASKCLSFARTVFGNGQVLVTATGGEPLTLKTLPLIVSLWTKNHARVRLCTTAAVPLEKGYWRFLYSCGIKTVHLSLPCISDEHCKTIFGEMYRFAVVNKNIDEMINAGIEISVNFLLTRLSAQHFADVLDYCHEKGIQKVRILGLARQGKSVSNWSRIAVSRDDADRFIKRTHKLWHDYPIRMEFAGLPNYEICTHMDNDGNCLGGKSFFHINTNGDIYPCPSVKSIKANRLGSIFQVEKFEASDEFFCEITRQE